MSWLQSWEFKSLFLLGLKLDIAVNCCLPNQDLGLLCVTHPAAILQQPCSALTGTDVMGSVVSGRLVEVPWGNLVLSTVALTESQAGNLVRWVRGKARMLQAGLHSPTSLCSTPCCGGQVDKRGCAFLPARVEAAPACPHAFLRGCTPQPLLQLACKWPSPFVSPFLQILA